MTGSMELLPGEEAEQALREIKQEMALLCGASDSWCAHLAENVNSWLRHHEEAEPAVRELLTASAEELGREGGREMRLSCPWPERSPGIRVLLREALGSLPEGEPFPERLTVLADAPEDLYAEETLRNSCRISLEEDAAYCAVLLPLSQTWAAAAAKGELSVPLSRLSILHVREGEQDLIRVEMTVEGRRPLTLTRNYTPEELRLP